MAALTPLSKGASAPHFPYLEADGTVRNTNELAGQSYLVYFYPKDDTPGCTKEACAFRDQHEEFLRQKVTVIGVSPDDDASHATFRKKFNLPFALASDPDHAIADAYGVWGPKNFMGRQYDGVHRVTFVIDPHGRVARVYPKVKPEQHAHEILQDLPSLHEQS